MGRAAAGKIIEPPKANIRKHERQTAEALASAGFIVEFVVRSTLDNAKTPDVLVDGVYSEIKSPKTDKLRQILYNLKKAKQQSKHIIIDTQRIKGIPDKSVLRFLKNVLKEHKDIKNLWVIDKHRKVIDVMSTGE